MAAARTVINPTRTEVDPKALDRAQQKFALALKLTHRFDVQAKADGLGNDHWRNELLANLMRIDEGDFAAVASATAVNDALVQKPEAVNTDPHGSWMIAVKVWDAGDASELLDASTYTDLTK